MENSYYNFSYKEFNHRTRLFFRWLKQNQSYRWYAKNIKTYQREIGLWGVYNGETSDKYYATLNNFLVKQNSPCSPEICYDMYIYHAFSIEDEWEWLLDDWFDWANKNRDTIN